MFAQAIVSIVALFIGLVLLVSGNSMLSTISALRLDMEGTGAGLAGLVLAFYSVGFVIGCVHGVGMIQRVGHIRAFAAFAALGAAATLMHPLHVSVDLWMALRLVVGFCIAGLMLVTESWVNGRATPETRGKLLAAYMVVFFLASAGGQFLISLGDPALHPLFIIAGILITLSLVPISLTRSPAPEIGSGERMGIRELWRLSPVGVAGALLSGVAMSAFFVIGPIYANRMGLATGEIGAFMGIAVLAAMLLQWPIGYLSDFIPRRRVIFAVIAIATAAALFAAVAGGRSLLLLYGSAALFYGLGASLYPLSLALTHDALTHDALDHSRIVPASASFLFAFGAGAIVGPPLGGLCVGLLGPRGLFLFIAAVLGLLLVVALQPLRRAEVVAVEDQAHCVGVSPSSTPVILELDPRNEEFELKSEA